MPGCYAPPGVSGSAFLKCSGGEVQATIYQPG
jgi:hypothetical protein